MPFMGRARTEADKPYPYTDIKNITFIPTEGKSGEITAQITREAPPDKKISLGVPEKARGRLNWMSMGNAVGLIAKIAIGGIPAVDGTVRFSGSGDIVSACEAISGVAIMAYSYRDSIRIENTLSSIRESLGSKIKAGLSDSLNPSSTKPPKR